MTLLVPREAFDDQPVSHAVLDWRSFKLQRIARSSLSAETQAAATAADSLEFAKLFWPLMLMPDAQVLDDTLRTAYPSALVIDAN